MEWMKRLDMDPAFADRYLNEGFSGGEKKRNEILQMAILEPDLAILDETDSGLDIDALRVVASGVREVRKDRPDLGVLLITHYQRILDELTPDVVHILVDGRIVESGGADLARRLEREGYDAWRDHRGHVIELDVATIKKDFPILDASVNGHRLVYLDSAASSQKPTAAVLDAMDRLLRDDPRQRAPRRLRHRRGGHGRATRAPGPRSPASSAPPAEREIIFTKNVTEAINLVAHCWGRANLGAGDAVVLTEMEHHANLVPWLMLRRGARASSCATSASPTTDVLDLSDLDAKLDGAKLLAVTAMSNVLGTINAGPPARRRRPRRRRVVARRRRPVRAPPRHRRRRHSAPTSSPSPATRCSGPPASACSGAARSCSTPCRRSSAAAR